MRNLSRDLDVFLKGADECLSLYSALLRCYVGLMIGKPQNEDDYSEISVKSFETKACDQLVLPAAAASLFFPPFTICVSIDSVHNVENKPHKLHK